VASDGAVWVAESSLDTLVRIDGSGATASYPIGDTNTSVHSLLPAADGAMWFAGFQTFGRVSRDGTVGLLPGFDDPGAMAPAGDAVYAFVESVEPSLLRATEDGVDLTSLSSELGGASVPAMASAADGNLWLAIAPSVDGSTGPALARLPIDGGSEVERIDLDDVTALHSLVIGPDNGQWFAGTRDDGSGVVGHRLPSGQIEFLDTPDEVVAWRLLSAPDAVWFVSDTSLGRIATADNTVAVWPIPNAERLAGIALAPDGTFWLTDSEADVVHHVTLVER
jgi:virginiamycin B lyase